jgi:hypothetical protein
MTRRHGKPNALWRTEGTRKDGRGFIRLIGPLAQQNGRTKTICIAIGSKRLEELVPILNKLDVKV